MQHRTLLRKHLAAAWKRTIKYAYGQQLINSERGLQIYFCSNLLRAFRLAKVPRRLFIEPCLSQPGTGEFRYPDIVICHSRRIIAVVEIKYQPRVAPSYTKDLDTLAWIAGRSDLTLSNDRYLGKCADAKKYALAPDALFCWAGVYQGETPDLAAQTALPKSHFVHLHAVTSAGEDPTILLNGRST